MINDGRIMAVRKGILALDCDTKTSHSFWKGGDPILSGTYNLPKIGAHKGSHFYTELGNFGLEAVKMIQGLDSIHKPAIILYESPFSGKPSSAPTLYGLLQIVTLHCVKNGIKFVHTTPDEWRSKTHKLVQAKGKTYEERRKKLKAAAVSYCLDNMGVEVSTDDEAEAVCILDWYATVNDLKKDWGSDNLIDAIKDAT